MSELQVLLNVVVALVIAFFGGALAQRVGLPTVVGYLVAGVAIGPFTPGYHVNQQSIGALAEIGIAFLMFAVGAEFSQVELRRLGKVALAGGTLQILLTMALGPALGRVLGASLSQGIFLGALVALSSTIVALKVLMGRGELQSLHGRAAVAVLIAQDLAVIPMVVILPALGSGVAGKSGGLVHLLLLLGEAVALVVGTYVVGTRIVPWILGHVAVPRSRELSLLGVVGLALGVGLIAQSIGLSLAFGAFLAGLVIAESQLRTQVVAEILPFRDLFTSLFFVSVGMLIDPIAILAHAGAVTLLTAVVLIGKFLLVVVSMLAVGLPGRVAVLTGLGLAQVGEFSFLLARIGVDQGAIPRLFFDLILAVSVITIVVSPFTFRAAPPLLRGLQLLPLAGRFFREPAEPSPEVAGVQRHAVVCGYGRVGRQLVDALERRKVPLVVVEYNPAYVTELRSRGVPVIFGDASNPGVLDHAHLEGARLVAALVPDAGVTELIVRSARAQNPRVDIVARARDEQEVERLRELGAREVVQPEFEAGVEVIRHALQSFGVSGPELTIAISGRRRRFYQREEPRGEA
ncbi:MAG: cation:proton antiporter [bacterium]|jgi:CPA2 family monovalent cation:H+ antiporter-2|nr:cation:proton antiporter [bacterium]